MLWSEGAAWLSPELALSCQAQPHQLDGPTSPGASHFRAKQETAACTGDGKGLERARGAQRTTGILDVGSEESRCKRSGTQATPS